MPTSFSFANSSGQTFWWSRSYPSIALGFRRNRNAALATIVSFKWTVSSGECQHRHAISSKRHLIRTNLGRSGRPRIRRHVYVFYLPARGAWHIDRGRPVPLIHQQHAVLVL